MLRKELKLIASWSVSIGEYLVTIIGNCPSLRSVSIVWPEVTVGKESGLFGAGDGDRGEYRGLWLVISGRLTVC